MIEGIEVGVRDEEDRAACAAVSPGGPTLGDELLATERDTTLAAPPGADAETNFVDERHGETGSGGLGDRACASTAAKRSAAPPDDYEAWLGSM